jgi:hypothetical protein
MVRLLAAALVLAFGLGCPILDELDKSSAEMDKYSPSAQAAKAKAEKEAAEKAAAPSGTSAAQKAAGAADQAKQAASQWWSNAKSLAPDEADGNIVRCILPDGEQFMARHDCQMRAGIAKAR